MGIITNLQTIKVLLESLPKESGTKSSSNTTIEDNRIANMNKLRK